MQSNLTIVSGCNASGKSSFIRSRMNEIDDYSIIMPDVYKSNTESIFNESIENNKNIVLESIFNHEGHLKWIELAREKKYTLTLIQLFVQSPRVSFERASFRNQFENGLVLDKNQVLQNFNLNFKAVCNNYYAFDSAYFIYTGDKAENKLMMAFQKGTLMMYKSNNIAYLQAFSDYVKRIGKDFEGFDKIELNEDYSKEVYIDEPYKEERKGFRI